MTDDYDSEIDDEIIALIPGYLESRRNELILLNEALTNKDVTIIAKIAHNIKGTAISYKQQELDAIAQVLIVASQNSNWEVIKSELDKLNKFLRR